MPKLDDELWLADRLNADIFEGVTDYDTRKMRMRVAIKGKNLETSVVGKRRGHDITYGQAFERLWGEPL